MGGERSGEGGMCIAKSWLIVHSQFQEQAGKMRKGGLDMRTRRGKAELSMVHHMTALYDSKGHVIA